jgi:FlaA1/EpsC-like NDP-sugar epimerase
MSALTIFLVIALGLICLLHSRRKKPPKTFGTSHVVLIVGATSDLGKQLAETLASHHKDITLVLIDNQER